MCTVPQTAGEIFITAGYEHSTGHIDLKVGVVALVT